MHQLDEAWKTGRDERAVVDTNMIFGAETHHQCRHRDPMIHVRLHFAAAGRTTFALDDHIVPFDLDDDTVDAQHVGRCYQPVRLFHTQFLQPTHAGHTFSEGSGNRQYWILID